MDINEMVGGSSQTGLVVARDHEVIASRLENEKEPLVLLTNSSKVGLKSPYSLIISELKRYSNRYGAIGWHQIPVNGKVPSLKDWPNNGQLTWQDSWGEKNLGILTGEKSGIIVLDVDPRHGGDKSIAELQKKYGVLDTVMVKTGGAGYHFYFKCPQAVKIRNSANKIGDGLDIRGDGGYVVAPPSVHPDTNVTYEWVEGHAPWEKEMAELPEWLLEKTTTQLALVPVVIDKEIGSIPEGSRNDKLFRLTCSLIIKGLEMETTLAAIKAENKAKCSEPLEEEEIELMVVGAYERYKNPTLPGLMAYPKIDAKGKVLKDHWENTRYACEWLGISFQLNLLTKETEVIGDSKLQLSCFGTMLTKVRSCLMELGYWISEEQLVRHVDVIAETNQYHPIQDYLLACQAKWDGESRVEQLFDCFVFDPKDSLRKLILQNLFRKWLVSCVVMAFNEGESAAQGVLVLKGQQGVGKTRWLQYLLPECGRTWGKDSVALDPTNKDDVMKATRFWIVELGEIRSSIRQEKLDRLKAFITESTDVYRRPYDRKELKAPRRTVFFGTVNNDQFLKDDTGERRYWILPIADIQLDQSLDINQLWGEITHLALNLREPHWLNREEIKEVNDQNAEYRVISREEQVLIDTYNWGAPKEQWFEKTAKEACLDGNLSSNHTREVGKILTRMATEGLITQRRINSKGNVYMLPPLLISMVDPLS